MADELSSPASSVAENLQDSLAANDNVPSSNEEQFGANPITADQVEDEDDDDDDLPSKRRGKTGNTEVDGDDADEEGGAGLGDDLFGDEDENAEPAPRRQLDDEDLDSGDDLGRDDRVASAEDGAPDVETVEQQIVTMDMELPRHPLPEPSDGEMYLLKVPTFMSIEPKAWDYTKFQPPTTEHHSKMKPEESFSAYNTAVTTVRWRRSPNNPSELQSNARINRWSDGSLTLQLASDPLTHYEMDGSSLAPPQRNPIKPTPVSVHGGTKAGRQGMHAPDEKYDQTKDSFTYLVAPSIDAEALRITHKITAALLVKQSEVAMDDALEKLQKSLAEAANATKVNVGSNLELAQLTEDPELGRKRAEIAEREKERARKKREAAEDRQATRTGRVLGRHGLSSGRYDSGLTIGALEDDELGTTAGSNRNKGPRRPRQRRNSEYSDEEENGRKAFRATQEDYEVDDFVADDDDEEEVVEDDEEEEEEELLDEPRPRSPKRPAEDEDDEDAEAEPDDEVSAPKAKRQRKIVDEDDEDE